MPRKGLEDVQSGHDSCRAKHAHSSDFTLGAVPKSYGPDLLLEPIHVEAALDFDIPKKICRGDVVTTILVNVDQAKTIKLDGVNFVDATVYDPDNHPLNWSYDGKQFAVTWLDDTKKGETRRLGIRYTLDSPITGMLFSSPDEHYPDRALFAGTDNETERARYWYPCIDCPTVRTTFDWHLTSEKSHTAVANGLLQSETETPDGRKTSHWKLDFRCPSYLACVCVGEFVVVEDEEVDGVPVAYIAPKNTKKADIMKTFDETPRMIRWLTKKVNRPFPFKKYYQILLTGVGGAMENISLVTWDDILLVDEILALEWKLSVADAVNIHEMAHSFFGDALVCKFFEHSWLKESWATYMEAVWAEDTQSQDDFRYLMYGCASRYFLECGSYVRPIVTKEYDHSWHLFDRHLYPGGAWRIHMLRKLMGDEAFWAAISDYLSTHHDGLVETEDFKRALEKHSGRNLTKFFDQWIHGRGYPKLKGQYVYSAEKQEAVISFEQTQKDDKRQVGLFDIELEVELIAENEDQPRCSKLRLDDITGKGSLQFAGLKGKPVSIRVDPDSRVLFALEFNPGEDILGAVLARTEKNTDVRSRIWAGSELIKIGTKSSIEKVRKAMQAEPYFGVRNEIATALGNKKSALVVDTLLEMLANEKEPRVFAALATAHGGFRDKRLREGLVRFLTNGERTAPYRAQWAGYQALANHNNPEDVPLFKNAALIKQRFVSSGAVRALGKLHNLGSKNKELENETYHFLKSLVEYGQPLILETVRPAAIAAFAEFSAMLGKKKVREATEVLVDLLREPLSSIKTAAIEALLTLEAKEAVSAVRSVQPEYALQYQPWVERKLRQFHKEGDSDAVVKLKKDVEELESRLRKLEDAQQEKEKGKE